MALHASQSYFCKLLLCSPKVALQLHYTVQAKICFEKFWIVYWRTPEYNGTRFSFTVGVALLFGAIFWKLGSKM